VHQRIPSMDLHFPSLSSSSLGAHQPSLVPSLIIAFAILRNYDYFTDAFRNGFALGVTSGDVFRYFSMVEYPSPLAFYLPPCVLWIRFLFQMEMFSERLRYLQMRLHSTSSAACTRLRFLWQLSASFRSRKLDCLPCVSVCF
jgi:hypothetical protein